MDYTNVDFGCYIMPVESYFEEILDACKYRRSNCISKDSGNLLIREGQEHFSLGFSWESLGARKEALDSYSQSTKTLLFVKKNCELSINNLSLLENILRNVTNRAIDLYNCGK